MLNKHFGQICASLRKELFNPVAGQQWNQADLAAETNLSVKIIGQIERGEKVKLHGDILVSLASAFGLTTAERIRFLSLANDVTKDEITRPKQTLDDIFSHTLEVARQVRQPVLLHDGLYRIIALNSAYRAVYGLQQSYLDGIPDSDITKYHIVRHIHDPASPVRQAYENSLDKTIVNNAIYWRYLSIAHRYDPLFDELHTQLLQSFTTFARQWATLGYELIEGDKPGLLRTFAHNHPALGPLSYLVLSTPITSSDREIFMASLLPLDERTHGVFDRLISADPLNFSVFEPVMQTLTFE